jgi:hypothetical protein
MKRAFSTRSIGGNDPGVETPGWDESSRWDGGSSEMGRANGVGERFPNPRGYLELRCKLPRLVRISKAEVRAGVGVGLLLAEKAWGQVAQ